tara:strand:+ start:2921 stop:3103 length:183 start_codon:yes stop_codon:yes gene_type:complete
MAKSYKQQKTKERFSKDVVSKQRKKERQFGKDLANNYIEFDEEEEDVYIDEDVYGVTVRS